MSLKFLKNVSIYICCVDFKNMYNQITLNKPYIESRIETVIHYEHHAKNVFDTAWDTLFVQKGAYCLLGKRIYLDESIMQLKNVIKRETVRQYKEKIRVYIGYEMASAHVESCSLAVSKYKARNGLSGKIAVLGPTRMNYQKVISALDYFSELIEELI